MQLKPVQPMSVLPLSQAGRRAQPPAACLPCLRARRPPSASAQARPCPGGGERNREMINSSRNAVVKGCSTRSVVTGCSTQHAARQHTLPRGLRKSGRATCHTWSVATPGPSLHPPTFLPAARGRDGSSGDLPSLLRWQNCSSLACPCTTVSSSACPRHPQLAHSAQTPAHIEGQRSSRHAPIQMLGTDERPVIFASSARSALPAAAGVEGWARHAGSARPRQQAGGHTGGCAQLIRRLAPRSPSNGRPRAGSPSKRAAAQRQARA